MPHRFDVDSPEMTVGRVHEGDTPNRDTTAAGDEGPKRDTTDAGDEGLKSDEPQILPNSSATVMTVKVRFPEAIILEVNQEVTESPS